MRRPRAILDRIRDMDTDARHRDGYGPPFLAVYSDFVWRFFLLQFSSRNYLRTIERLIFVSVNIEFNIEFNFNFFR